MKYNFYIKQDLNELGNVRIHRVLQYKNINLKFINSNLNRNKNKLNLTMFRVKLLY